MSYGVVLSCEVMGDIQIVSIHETTVGLQHRKETAMGRDNGDIQLHLTDREGGGMDSGGR